MKKLWILIATVALVAGCQNKNSGGTGAGNEIGTGAGSSWSRSSDTNMPSQGTLDTNSNSRSRDINK
jgi:hypothetical protein